MLYNNPINPAEDTPTSAANKTNLNFKELYAAITAQVNAIALNTEKPSLTSVGTLTNKTLTEPVINNPTGLDSTDVGLENVTNDAQVKVEGAQAINGDKSFTNPVTVGSPTQDSHAVTKSFLDDNVDNLGTANAIRVRALEDISAGVGLRFFGAQEVTKGDAIMSSNTRNARKSGDFIELYQPFNLTGTEDNLKLRLYLRNIDLGNNTSNTYSRTVKIYAYDGTQANKAGSLIQTETKVDFVMPANAFYDEWDFSPDSSLIAGVKYTIAVEYYFVSGGGDQSNDVLQIGTFRAGATLGMTEAGLVRNKDNGGTITEDAGYVQIEIKQNPDEVDAIKVIEGVTDTTYNSDLIGFSEVNVLAGELVNLKTLGLVGGFSGLTPGSYYRVGADGAMNITNSNANIGIAVTATFFAFTGRAEQ